MDPQQPKVDTDAANQMAEELAEDAQAKSDADRTSSLYKNELLTDKNPYVPWSSPSDGPTQWMFDILWNSVRNRKTLAGKLVVIVVWVSILGLIGLFVKLATTT